MTHFEQELSGLKNTLLTMASHAESAVKQAVDAVVNRDYDLALRVKADDTIIDRFEVDVDELAIRLLAKAPLAGDLRLIAVTMKISQNLERVGDEATKIAKRARRSQPGSSVETAGSDSSNGRTRTQDAARRAGRLRKPGPRKPRAPSYLRIRKSMP